MIRLSDVRLAIAAMFLAVGCGGSSPTVVPTTSTPTPPAPPPAVDEPPVIDGIRVTPSPAEFRTNITVEATVHDKETPNERLKFEWSASIGTFTGSGSRVTWRLDQPPLKNSPVTVQITLKVSEDLPGGNTQSTSSLVSFTLNDSYKEAIDLANTFLADFTTYTASPEFVVRNFADSCRGKWDELRNVQVNRQLFVIDRAKSFWAIKSVTFDGNPPASKPFGNVQAPCTFVSLVKATGKTETAVGTCSLDAFYDKDRWLLCDSHFNGTSLVDRVQLGLHP